jgi:hypothetical protein
MTFQSRLGTLYATWYSCLWIQIQCGLLLGLIFLKKIGAIVDIEKKMIQICNGLGAMLKCCHSNVMNMVQFIQHYIVS